MKPNRIATRVLYALIAIHGLACSNKHDSQPLSNAEAMVKGSFDSNGTSIHFVSKGKGVPIILLHGFLANSNWNWIEPGTFDILAKNYRVIAMDVRGQGASDKPHSPDAYGKAILEDINNLMDHFNIDKATLVGYSMGGEIALAYLTSYPERVIKAVAGGCGWMKMNDEKFEIWKQYGDLLASTPDSVSITEQLWHVRDTTSVFFRMVNNNDPKASASVAYGMLQLSIEEAKLKANKVPILLLVGENDDHKKSAEVAVVATRNMKLWVLKDQDHLSAINDSLFVKAIADFVAEK